MKLPHRLWTVLLLVGGTLTAWHRETEADLFFHLDLGRAVLRHGARTVPEPTAFSTFAPDVVVPAWLWDLCAWGSWSIGGELALALFTLAAAALATLLVTLLCHHHLRDAPFLAFAVVSGAAVTVVSLRFAMRPQTLFMAVLPGFVLLVQLYRDAEGRRRMALGAALAATALVWAQLHGSFVLAPVLVLLLLAPGFRKRSTDDRRADGVVFALVLATLLTSSAGPDVVGYIVSHGSGEATRHIREMSPPNWSLLPELAPPSGKALTALWILAMFGVVNGRKIRWVETALAVLGLLLMSRAQRFVGVDAVLTVPLAARGAADLGSWSRDVLPERARRPLSLVILAAVGIVVGHQIRTSHATGGFGLGFAADAYPVLASRYLGRLPEGSNVLSAFSGGPYLGFAADGRIRTYVDGRVAMYFEDADFGLSQEVFSHPEALERAIARWSIGAAVVERDSPACEALRERWTPVVVESRYTTFVPLGSVDQRIEAVAPCGPRFFGPEVCAENGAALGRDIAHLEALGEVPSNELLRVARALVCRGEHGDDLAARLDASDVRYLAEPNRQLRIAWHLSRREAAPAFALFEEAIEDGDSSVAPLAISQASSALSAAQLREVLSGIAENMDASTPPALRARLALECVRLGDTECVRAQALRAAARGERNVMPALRWLRASHPEPRVRADAEAWARLLGAAAPPAGSSVGPDDVPSALRRAPAPEQSAQP